jgi:RNA polymerase sigma factor (sigma-70 family)
MDDDRAEFREFVTLHWSSLVAAAYLITTDRGIAEDCAQEAMARAHRRWSRVRQDGNPAVYARRAVVNAALSWRRRRRIQAVLLTPTDQATGAASEQVAQGLDDVDDVPLAELRSLSPQLRAAVALRYLEDRSETETAARPSDPLQTLPADLVERLHRLAENQTADGKPWPRVDLALRRAQRRRLGGLSAVTVVGVLIAGTIYAGLPAPTTRSEPASASDSLRREGLAQLRKAGYDGPTGGSLAGDAQWIAQVRERTRDLITELPVEGGRAVLSSPDEVLVPWTGELEGVRYALAVYPSERSAGGPLTKPQPTFAAVVLTGDQPDRMRIHDVYLWAEQQPDEITSGQLIWLTLGNPVDGIPATVAALGPTLTGVKVVSAQRFSSKGKVITQSRQLSKDGAMTWVGQLTAAEVYIDDIQLEGVGGSGSNASMVRPVYDRMRSIAPSGTDTAALDCASQPTPGLGSSIVDDPMIAATAPMSSSDTLGAAVLRSPDGLWLVSFCQSHKPESSDVGRSSRSFAGVFVGAADSDSFMAAVETPDRPNSDSLGCYLVVAPVGATTVRIGAETAKVKNRLAYFTYDDDRTGPQTVRALDADGTVIASVRSQLGQQT